MDQSVAVWLSAASAVLVAGAVNAAVLVRVSSSRRRRKAAELAAAQVVAAAEEEEARQQQQVRTRAHITHACPCVPTCHACLFACVLACVRACVHAEAVRALCLHARSLPACLDGCGRQQRQAAQCRRCSSDGVGSRRGGASD